MSAIFKLSYEQTIIGLDGNIAAGGLVHFYDKRSNAYAPVFGDPQRKVSLRQPVQADDMGTLPVIFLDPSVTYRAVITDRENGKIREIDTVTPHRNSVTVLAGIDELKTFCSKDPFVLVTGPNGCPVFYKRLSGCDLPKEALPDVVYATCGDDDDCCCEKPDMVWQMCDCETDICDLETADLTCASQVMVQSCGGEKSSVQKASVSDLLSAAVRCLPRVCIKHDAPELSLDPATGGLFYGDREPAPLSSTNMNAYFAACLRLFPQTDADAMSRHVQLTDAIVKDLNGNVPKSPKITLTNTGPCRKRYEIRALNRLSRIGEQTIGRIDGIPLVTANFQTRLGTATDPRLNDVWGVGDYMNTLNWLTDLSIADSTMGPFRSGTLLADNANPNYRGNNGYTQNDLIVDLNPGQSVTYVLKYHIYWDMNATVAQLTAAERIHYGTRIIARQIH